MTKVVYPSARNAAWKAANIPVDTDTIKLQLLDADYTYNAAHDFLDDIPAGARIGTAQTITTKTFGTIAAGVFDGDDVTIPTVAGGDTVVAYAIYDDTPATEATKPLIIFVNEKADGSAISILTNGGNIGVTFSASGIGVL